MTGGVLVRGQPQTKPGTLLDPAVEITLRVDDHPYVSRGALKLVKGLNSFAIDPAGQVALDIGASTGGFSDVLLRARGQSTVYGDPRNAATAGQPRRAGLHLTEVAVADEIGPRCRPTR
jgi:predicted rRNA methylase YqxC with S4 and FtsJ domains